MWSCTVYTTQHEGYITCRAVMPYTGKIIKNRLLKTLGENLLQYGLKLHFVLKGFCFLIYRKYP